MNALRCPKTVSALLMSLALSLSASSGQRAPFSTDSPELLRSVGRLTVPGYDFVDGERHFREEHCSATLVGPSTIVTAWHCLEHYRDLSLDPVFVLPNVTDHTPVIARRLADGGGMSADWALLRLKAPVRSIAPVPVSRYSFSEADAVLTLAGFARDAQIGQRGAHLTWESDCRQVANDWYRVGIDCVTYKGASGGPVFRDGKLVGVVSAGDGEGITFFAPSGLFLPEVRLYRH